MAEGIRCHPHEYVILPRKDEGGVAGIMNNPSSVDLKLTQREIVLGGPDLKKVSPLSRV